jgi:hypothetical protein
MVLGKTCRYCSSCEIVMVHRKELETELARGFSQVALEVIGKDYLVLGTIEKKIWQQGLGSPGKPIADMLKHVADFKHQYDLKYKSGGWYPGTEESGRD